MFYDLHMHSCLSPCAEDEMTPTNIVNMALIKELDLIALTDHNSTKNLPGIAKAAERAGLRMLYGEYPLHALPPKWRHTTWLPF